MGISILSKILFLKKLEIYGNTVTPYKKGGIVNKKRGKKMAFKTKEYALYKGEELLDVGTKKEIANRRGIKVESLSYYASPTYRKRTSQEHGLRLVVLED